MNKEEKETLTKKLYNHSQSVPQGDGTSEVMIRLSWAQKQIESMPEVKLNRREAWNKIAENYPQNSTELANICDTVMSAIENGQEVHILDGKVHIGKMKENKVKIPKYVADLIEEYRSDGIVLKSFLDSWRFLLLFEEDDFPSDEDKKEIKTIRWILENSEKFMSAWLNGYELEKQSLLFIVNQPNGYFKSFNNDMTWNTVVSKNEAFVFRDKGQADPIAEFIGGKAEKI